MKSGMQRRDRRVLQALLVEGLANLAVLGIRLLVGMPTGSLAPTIKHRLSRTRRLKQGEARRLQ